MGLLAQVTVHEDCYTLEHLGECENGKPYYVTGWGWTQGFATLDEARESLAYAVRMKIKYPFL